MLITFKSPAAPDVRMLSDLAQYLLGLVGKRLGERGVLACGELPRAIERLESAIYADQELRAEYQASRQLHTAGPGETSGGLSQRAFPFLDMLRQAREQDADILLGI
jgi:hypothetical protein